MLQLIKLVLIYKAVTCQSYNFSKLKSQLVGEVIEAGESGFQGRSRLVNKACSQHPLVIVVPHNTEDVSKAVKFSTEHGLQISVRSGGHSYTCTSIRQGGMHVDLRELNGVKLIFTDSSSTGIAAVLGPGSTWGRVQRFIPTAMFSYPHGQCRSVGVGGFLLAGGVNWLGTFNKYGFGAESVLSMKVVTANGTVVEVEPTKSIIQPEYPHEKKITLKYTRDNDLFYALRSNIKSNSFEH